MSGFSGSGCRIMKCAYIKEDICQYAGDRCKYNNPTGPMEAIGEVKAGALIKLKLALDSLGEISDAYYSYPNADDAAPIMREIADAALRRLSLSAPDA